MSLSGEYSLGDLLSLFRFDLKLTEDMQETQIEQEIGGLEYEDEEVEAFCRSLILRN